MNQAHPTDEQLSAALDDQDDGASAHTLECSSCQARQRELREVMALVAAPVHVDPVARDAAVAAAVRAGVGDGFMERGEIGIDSGRRRRRVSWVPIAAVAAVFAFGVLAVPRLISDDGDRGDQAQTLATGAAEGAGDEVGLTDGGDLGDVADGVAMLERVRPALGGHSAGGPPNSTATDDGVQLEASPAADTFASGAGGERAPVRCSGIARQEYGTGLGPLVYTASVRFKETTPDGGSVWTPGVVLAYQVVEPAGEKLRHRVLVLADGDCRLLSSVSL